MPGVGRLVHCVQVQRRLQLALASAQEHDACAEIFRVKQVQRTRWGLGVKSTWSKECLKQQKGKQPCCWFITSRFSVLQRLANAQEHNACTAMFSCQWYAAVVNR